MDEHFQRLSEDNGIEIGDCYVIRHNGATAYAKIIQRMLPNKQGENGPAKWIGRLIGAVDGPDGSEIEVTLDTLLRRATKRGLCIQAFRQGWMDDKDVQEYLGDFGIEINRSTIASYKSQYRAAMLRQQRHPKASGSVEVGQIVFDSQNKGDAGEEICEVALMNCLPTAKALVKAAGSWDQAHRALDVLRALANGLPATEIVDDA